MANLFCSECGEKYSYTLKKPKFCQSCGESFSGGISKASRDEEQEPREEGDIPFISKIDVAIEGLEKSTSTFKELVANPMNPSELQDPKKIDNYQQKDAKSYEAESMKECKRVTESKEV